MWRATGARQKVMSTAFALALALALAPGAASAEPKLEIGFRSGFAIPVGKLYERNEAPEKVSDLAMGQVPIWFDIGARLDKFLFVGAYVDYGVVVYSGRLKRECKDLEQTFARPDVSVTGDCSFHDLRLGAEVQYHLGKSGLLLDPWVGGGVGYEWLSLGMFYATSSDYEQDGDLTETFHGFEFLNLQSGLDFRMSDTTAFGPFVTFTVSTYRIVRTSCDGYCWYWDHGFRYIDDEAFHHWLFFGVRGSFLL